MHCVECHHMIYNDEPTWVHLKMRRIFSFCQPPRNSYQSHDNLYVFQNNSNDLTDRIVFRQVRATSYFARYTDILNKVILQWWIGWRGPTERLTRSPDLIFLDFLLVCLIGIVWKLRDFLNLKKRSQLANNVKNF